MEVTVKKVEITLGRHGLAQRTGQEIRLEYRQEEVRYREGTGGYQGRKNTQSEKRRRYVSTNPWLTHVPIGIHHEF